MDNIIEIRNLSKSYKSQILFNSIDINFEKGLCHFLVGKSGSGKSTFAKIILNLLKPDSGTILIDGKNIYSKDYRQYENILLVFQDPVSSLNPRLRVIDIFNIILDNIKIPKSDETLRNEKIDKFLNYMDFDKNILYKQIKVLSGGQKQRLSISRSIFQNPKIIIFDESFSNLDEETIKDVMSHILYLKKEFNQTYLFISHNTPLINEYADNIFQFSDGKVEKIKSYF